MLDMIYRVNFERANAYAHWIHRMGKMSSLVLIVLYFAYILPDRNMERINQKPKTVARE